MSRQGYARRFFRRWGASSSGSRNRTFGILEYERPTSWPPSRERCSVLTSGRQAPRYRLAKAWSASQKMAARRRTRLMSRRARQQRLQRRRDQQYQSQQRALRLPQPRLRPPPHQVRASPEARKDWRQHQAWTVVPVLARAVVKVPNKAAAKVPDKAAATRPGSGSRSRSGDGRVGGL